MYIVQVTYKFNHIPVWSFNKLIIKDLRVWSNAIKNNTGSNAIVSSLYFWSTSTKFHKIKFNSRI